MDVLIKIENISKIYRQRQETVYALREVNFDVLAGEYLSIMGPSGSGKSTLFNIVGALDRPNTGRVSIGPVELTELTSR